MSILKKGVEKIIKFDNVLVLYVPSLNHNQLLLNL